MALAIAGLVGAPWGRQRSPTATHQSAPSKLTLRRGASVHSSPSTVATAGE